MSTQPPGQQEPRPSPEQPEPTAPPLEKPFVERMKPYLQGKTWEPPILDPANPNLRQD